MIDPLFNRPRRQHFIQRPLLGLTILVVEDSLYACEALRLMCLRSGARIRRADSLASARRHLRVFRPSVAIVDLGLPDGSGEDLIIEMNRDPSRIPAIIATSAYDADLASLRGVDGIMPKPIRNMGRFQKTVLEALPDEMRPAAPWRLSEEHFVPDQLAYHDDMAHAASLLEEDLSGGTLAYVLHFLGGVARTANDTALAQAVGRIERESGRTPAGDPRRDPGRDPGRDPERDPIATLAGLIRARIAEPALAS